MRSTKRGAMMRPLASANTGVSHWISHEKPRLPVDAVSSAIADVERAIPKSKLTEATPDLVGLTDIAEILGCSRQNIRKLVIGHRSLFSSPIHEGSAAIWHPLKGLQWCKAKGTYAIEDTLIEVSKTTILPGRCKTSSLRFTET